MVIYVLNGWAEKASQDMSSTGKKFGLENSTIYTNDISVPFYHFFLWSSRSTKTTVELCEVTGLVAVDSVDNSGEGRYSLPGLSLVNR